MTAERSILDEAGEAVLRHRHVDTRSCQDRIVLEVMKPGCIVCQYDARDLAAAVLRVAEKHVRAMVAHYPEDVFPPDGATKDAISAAAMRHAYKTAADMLAEGASESGGSIEAELPEPQRGSEAAYWKAQANRARAERDALALRLLQMADAWQERFAETGIRVDVAADAVRATVENMGGR